MASAAKDLYEGRCRPTEMLRAERSRSAFARLSFDYALRAPLRTDGYDYFKERENEIKDFKFIGVFGCGKYAACILRPADGGCADGKGGNRAVSDHRQLQGDE
jgi:hypothetical protein